MMKFTEEQMRTLGVDLVPVIERIKELEKKHGVGALRLYVSSDYITVEGKDLDGWELHKFLGDYKIEYRKEADLCKEEGDTDT